MYMYQIYCQYCCRLGAVLTALDVNYWLKDFSALRMRVT